MPFGGENTIVGWGVFRVDPWHFVGVFPTQGLAEQEATSKGGTYIARYGSNEKGTENFIWKNESVVFGCGDGEDAADDLPLAEAYAPHGDAF